MMNNICLNIKYFFLLYFGLFVIKYMHKLKDYGLNSGGSKRIETSRHRLESLQSIGERS